MQIIKVLNLPLFCFIDDTLHYQFGGTSGWSWSLGKLRFSWKIINISRMCLYWLFRCTKERRRLQRCQTIISLEHEGWMGSCFSCLHTIYAALSCSSFNQVLWSNSGPFCVIHRAGFTLALQRENVKCLYLQSSCWGCAGCEQGRGISVWPQLHHRDGERKGEILNGTRGAKSHLQSCLWEKLGLSSSILWSFLAAPGCSFPLVGWLWAEQSQSWVSVNKSSCLDVFTLLPCRDCAGCEQTQQINQPGELWTARLLGVRLQPGQRMNLNRRRCTQTRLQNLGEHQHNWNHIVTVWCLVDVTAWSESDKTR